MGIQLESCQESAKGFSGNLLGSMPGPSIILKAEKNDNSTNKSKINLTAEQTTRHNFVYFTFSSERLGD